MVANGFTVTDDEGRVTVFEDNHDGPQEDDPENTRNLLCHVMDYFGLAGTRYDEKKVWVKIEPGDKYVSNP